MVFLIEDVLESQERVLTNVQDIFELGHGEWELHLCVLLELRKLFIEVCFLILMFSWCHKGLLEFFEACGANHGVVESFLAI